MKMPEDRFAFRRKVMAAVPVAALLTGLVAFTAPGDASDDAARLSESTLTSLAVSPDVIAAGGTAMGTVKRNTTFGTTVVNLTSANPAIATVPSSITIAGRTSAGSFTVTGTRGGGGCTTISATTVSPRGGTASTIRSGTIAVAPYNPRWSPLTLRFGSGSGVATSGLAGQTFEGTVTLSSPTTRGVTVAITSGATRGMGGLDHPASVYIAPGQSSASVSVKERSPGALKCAVVTASLGRAASKRLLLFWASPEGW
jgi:hypothetical protein